MKLSSVHILLTYQCTLECDHCFVWSSPWQSGVLTLENLREVLYQSKGLGTVKSIYFEGGEPYTAQGSMRDLRSGCSSDHRPVAEGRPGGTGARL